MIAGITFRRFYFRLFNGSIKSPQIVEFLKAVQATIGKKAKGWGEVKGWSSSTQPRGEAQISPWSPTPASAMTAAAAC